MADDMRLDTASLVGLVLQAFIYGIFQTLFIACVYVLVYRRKTDHINWHFLITAILMWILIGVYFALTWSRIMDTFITLQPELAEDPEAFIEYFANLGEWKEIARTCSFVILTAVADSLFIYRCFIVWGRNKYTIIIPVLLLCCSTALGIAVVVIVGSANGGVIPSNVGSMWTSFLGISLVQNILTTFLIVYRIWRVNVSVTILVGSRSLWPVISVLLESAAIYSSLLVILLVLFASGRISAEYIVLDILVPTIGVVFNLIIVHVGLGLSRSPGRCNTRSGDPGSAMRFPVRTLSIAVSQHVSVSRDLEHAEGTTIDGKNDFPEMAQTEWIPRSMDAGV